MPVGCHVTGSPWNKHSGTSEHYKSSKWKKLKSQEQFWKWFMIGGALRNAFIVTGTSPFTSLRWQTHSASGFLGLPCGCEHHRSVLGAGGHTGTLTASPELWGLALNSPRVRELQIRSDILSMRKDTSCGVGFFSPFYIYTITMLLSARINIL